MQLAFFVLHLVLNKYKWGLFIRQIKMFVFVHSCTLHTIPDIIQKIAFNLLAFYLPVVLSSCLSNKSDKSTNLHSINCELLTVV